MLRDSSVCHYNSENLQLSPKLSLHPAHFSYSLPFYSQLCPLKICLTMTQAISRWQRTSEPLQQEAGVDATVS
jgi:hypothetical protein